MQVNIGNNQTTSYQISEQVNGKIFEPIEKVTLAHKFKSPHSLHLAFLFLSLFILRERERERERGSASRGRGERRKRERIIPGRLHDVRAEPEAGLKLRNPKIMT